jgi:hypothetical protein
VTLVLQIAGIAAAVDATKEPEIAARYNIRGYPAVKYFKAGEFAFDVNVRDAAKIIEFMRNPHEPPPPPPPETPWSEEPSEVVHLTEETFKTFLKKKKHVLVMFYAPCKYSQKVDVIQNGTEVGSYLWQVPLLFPLHYIISKITPMYLFRGQQC